MRQLNAFVTPEYPVIFDVVRPGDAPGAVPEGQVGMAVALLVDGIPAYLATHVVPREEMKSVAGSLEAGNARVAVMGVPVQMKSPDGTSSHHPAAFVSLLCADGRRLSVARVVAHPEETRSSRDLARHVSRQIARGAQISDLVKS